MLCVPSRQKADGDKDNDPIAAIFRLQDETPQTAKEVICSEASKPQLQGTPSPTPTHACYLSFASWVTPTHHRTTTIAHQDRAFWARVSSADTTVYSLQTRS